MACLTEKAFADIEARKEAIRRRARQGRSGGGEHSMGPYSGERVGFQTGRDQRLYQAFRDVPFTAIRPIAVRFASKPLKAAAVPARKIGRTRDDRRREMLGELQRKDYVGGWSKQWDRDQEKAWQRMPDHVKSALPREAVVLDDHEVLAAMQRPNPAMGPWETSFNLVASIMLTGHAMLLWDEENLTPGIGDREGTPGVYYVPMHWARPDHSKGALQRWKISPPNTGWSDTVEQGEFVYFRMPNPEDPFRPFSPTMAGARTLNTADKISEAHYAGLENMVNPRYAFSIGRPQGPDGAQGRPVLRRKQRQRLAHRLKSYLQGVSKNGEIFLLDGLIDNVQELGAKPRDIDFENGARLTERRTMEVYGTSPVVAGYTENANRAGSIIATEVFDNNVINPLLTLSGNAFTHALSPKYSSEKQTIIFYHEESKAEDPDAMQRRAQSFPGAFALKEQRHYIRTGEIDWEDDDVDELKREQAEAERRQRASLRNSTRPGEGQNVGR